MSGARQRVSCCVITRDEERHLPGALASVAFCDETIVVDSGSTDRTVELARAAGATVVEHPWRGFAAQRNVALDHASGDWVLELDADERITPPLAAEILAFLEDPPADVDLCALPMAERIGRHELRPSAKYPFYRSRLFRRSAYRHDERRLVHEGIEARGRVHVMRGDMIHLLSDGPSELIADAWRYARLHAGNLEPPASPAGYVTGIVVRPLAKTAYRVVVDGGWRDGPAGLLRIATDVGTDAVIWARVLARAGAEHGGTTGTGRRGSVAHEPRRAGPTRLVGIAPTAPQTAEVAAWLAEAARRGADVVLVSAHGDHACGQVPIRAVPRVGPILLARALDALTQARPIDALVLARATTARRLRLTPSGPKGYLAPVTIDDDPGEVVDRVGRTRAQPATAEGAGGGAVSANGTPGRATDGGDETGGAR